MLAIRLSYTTHLTLLMLAIAALSQSALSAPPQKNTCDTSLQGFATLGAGTTGGGTASPVTVTTIEEMRKACNGAHPAVVVVSGTITTGPNPVNVGSNKSILGQNGAIINGGLTMVNGTSNVIIRYLTIKGAGKGNFPETGIGGLGTKNVWIDHCDISDAGKGLIYMSRGSDLITVSWTKFWYSDTTYDRVAITFGSMLNEGEFDRGKLRVTFLGNHFSANVTSGMARVRYGHAHYVNNLYNAPGNQYAIGVATESKTFVENNVFLDISNPIQMRDINGTAYVTDTGNIYHNTFGDRVSGLIHGTGTPFTQPLAAFNPVSSNSTDPLTKMPYTLKAIPASQVEQAVRSCAKA